MHIINMLISKFINAREFLNPNTPVKPFAQRRRINGGDLVVSLPYIIIHFIALGAFFFPFEWKWAGLCIGLYYLRMFGITAGYHRYFSHRTYKTSRAFQFVLACIGGAGTQKGALWWGSHHRLHHRYSDSPKDTHSPVQDGFFWAHLGWFWSRETEHTEWEQIPDLAKYPELVWLNKYHYVPTAVLGLITFLVWGWAGLFWGFWLSTVFVWHATSAINSMSHVFGSQRYRTGDTSKNNWILAILTMGEGWHNNHHCYQASVNQGFYWWEFDASYLILKGLSLFGIVWDLKKPPLHLLEAKQWKQLATVREKNAVRAESPLVG